MIENVQKIDDPFYFLFDYDGVLIHKINFARYVAVNHGVNEEALGRFFKKYLQPCLRGEKDMIQLLGKNLEELRWNGSAKELFEAIYLHDRLYQADLLQLIEQKIHTKYDCYVATNQDRHRFDMIKGEPEIQQYFHEVFSSSELGVAKPDPEYFQRIFEELQKRHKSLTTSQLVFVDDIPENVESAESLGIHGHLFRETRAFSWFVDRITEGHKFPELNTDCFSLVNMKFSHAKGYSDILSEPDTYRFLTESGPKNKEKALEKIIMNRQGFDQGKAIYWSVEGENGEFLGYLGAHNLHTSTISMSFGIHPAFRRQGIARETLKTVLDSRIFNRKSIELATHLNNNASFTLLSSMGLPYKGIAHTQFGERHVFRIEK